MDLSKITDMNQLKALAYDQIAAKEQAEGNLRVINQRIGELAGTISQEEVRAAALKKGLPVADETTTETTTAAPESGSETTAAPGAESN